MREFKLILVGLFLAVSLQSQSVFKAVLTGEQEVPAVQSNAFGHIDAVLDGNELVVTGSFENLSSALASHIAGGIHIHTGIAGSNGPVALVLDAQVDSEMKSGEFLASENTFSLDANQIAQLQNRMMYVNIHSENFESGELRGQLLPSSDLYFQSSLSGNQEVPAVISRGSGVVLLELNGNQLTLSGSFWDLESPIDPSVAMGAHIHSGMAGENGGVDIILNVDVNAGGKSGIIHPGSNTFTVDQEMIDKINARGTYVNLHTEAFQSGELRGQITGMASSIWRAALSGANGKPYVDSRGNGAVIAEYYSENSTLVVSGSMKDLESDLAVAIAGGVHIHAGMAGQNGPVGFVINTTLDTNELRAGSFLPGDNTFNIEEEQVLSLEDRGFYVNIHSEDNPAGEIRGQLLPVANYHFNAFLGGSQEVPSVTTGGRGALKVEWVPGKLIVSGSFDNLLSDFDIGIAGGAHIHLGLPGQNGGIAFHLNTELSQDRKSGVFMPIDNQFEIGMQEENALIARGLYANIHTENFPAGEIRGQILREAHAYYQANLSGSQEVPSILTPAFGNILLERTDMNIVPVGSFDQLQSDFAAHVAGGAHIHSGFAGQNGGIVTSINPILSSDDRSGSFSGEETIAIDPPFWDALQERSLYVNIHSDDIPSGEIRGQITGLNSSLFRAHIAGVNEIPAVESRGMGSLFAELDNGGNLIVSGSFSNLESPVNEGIAGGIHLHVGYSGQNGPVTLLLETDIESDGKAGSFSALNNVYSLDEAQWAQLLERALYVNIHTLDLPSGEIRGQLMGDAQYVFTSILSGTQEVPSLPSSGYGMAKAEWSNGRIIFSGFAGNAMDSLARSIAGGVHLHTGFPGQNGPVALVIETAETQNQMGLFDFTISPVQNNFEIDANLEGMISSRQSYLNFHTNQYPQGELRGQVLREALGYYFTNLYGSNEFPSVNSPGSGAIQMEWYGDEAVAFGSFSNLSSAVDTSIAGGMHIHWGLPGQNGPVAALLVPTLDPDGKSGLITAAQNTMEVDEDMIENIRNRNAYVNIHSLNHAPGELRGQISGPATGILRSYLRGAEEVPQAMTSAGGSVHAELLADFSTMYYGSFDGLSADLASHIAGGIHIHTGFPGQNGPVSVVIESEVDSNNRGGLITVQKTPQDTAAFMASLQRATYVNIHSEVFPAGEIRGQLMSESQYTYTSMLSGLQEVNPVSSRGMGTVMVEKSGNRLVAVGSVSNLTGDIDFDIAGGAHIHEGLPGQNGGIIIPLIIDNIDGENRAVILPGLNIYDIDSSTIWQIENGETYVNIHTTEFPAGEVRGQLLAEANNYFISNLSGAAEVPPVRTPAAGTVLFEQYTTGMTAIGSFSGLESVVNVDIAGGAHIHQALFGFNGPVDQLLEIDLSDERTSGVFLRENNWLTPDQEELLKREYYVNIHSVDRPSGEIRGQIIPLQTAAFTANLSGWNEVQPASSSALGQLLIEYNGVDAIATGSFSGLGSEIAAHIAGGVHLHIGDPSENGPVDILLSADLSDMNTAGTFSTEENSFELNTVQLDDLFEGMFYINIHSESLPGGEIRGQLLPAINFFPSEDAGILFPQNGEEVNIQGDPEEVFTVNWAESFDRDAVVYLWQLSESPDFDDHIALINAGSSQSLEMSYSDLQDLLLDHMVNEGDTVELFHRVIASDGSLLTPGAHSSVIFTLGPLVNTTSFEEIGNRSLVYPNPVRVGSEITVDIASAENREVTVNLIDLNGRVLRSETLNLHIGNNEFKPFWNIDQSGIYLISITDNNGKTQVHRISVLSH